MPLIFVAWFFVGVNQAKAIELTTSQTWTKAQSPIIISEYTWLKAGAKLTIEPGVIIKFKSGSSIYLVSSGEILAQGTSAEPIIFTSFKDDERAGDSNNDGAASLPLPGDWMPLYLSSNSSTTIAHAVFNYGGSGNQGAIVVSRGKLTVNNSVIAKNNGGIANTQGQVAVSNSSIFNNLIPFIGGVKVDSGLSNNNQASIIVNAVNNWWGSADGPCPWRQLLPPGVPIWQADIKAICGDKALVDTGVVYSPWLTAPPSESIEHEPVILVPGILGSWNISGRWQLDPIFHTYDNLMEALIAAGYKENSLDETKPTLFTFPYDWRADNNLTAGLLREKINQVKQITGASKVDIVAHSMGGLVTRSYAQSDDYQNDIDQVIFLGTPHKGSPESYLKYEGAYFKSNFVPIQKYLFQIEAAFNGYTDLADYIRAKVLTVEQLLPVYNYLKDKQPDNSWQLRSYPLNYPQNSYLENLNSSEKINLLKQRVDVTNIISNLGESSTINLIKVILDPNQMDNKWQNGYPENLDNNLTSLEKGNGDSTVPLSSTNSLSGVEVIETNDSDHTNLPTVMQKEVIQTLTGQLPESYFNSKITSTFKKWLFFRVYSPVDFSVIAPDGSKVGKDFTSNSEVNEISDAFYSGFNDEAEFVLIPNPADGEYKVEIQGVDGGGEYTLAGSLINNDEETEARFTGTIAPDAQKEFILDYSAEAENPLSELAPVDTLAPVISVASPAENFQYLHNQTLNISYTATDDFSGLATTAVMLDNQAITASAIDLFYLANGSHELKITALDLAGNFTSRAITFKIISTLDSTISDINRLYQSGSIMDRTASKILIKEIEEVKWRLKLLDEAKSTIAKYVKKVGNSSNNTKTKAKLVQRYNEDLARSDKDYYKHLGIIFDRMEKTLKTFLKVRFLNQQAYDIIKDDVNYLRNNL